MNSDAAVPVRVAVVSDALYPWHTGGKEIRYHEVLSRLAKQPDLHIEAYTMHWWRGANDTNIASDGSYHGEVTFRAICPNIPMYDKGRRSIRQGLLFALATLRMLRVRVDVIEADQMPGLQLYPLWLVAKIRRIPLVVTWHEYWGGDYWRSYLGHRPGAVAALIERIAARLGDHIICVSDDTARSLTDAGIDPSRITVLPNGVGVTSTGSNSADTSTRHGYVSVGRLLTHKRFDVAIAAIAELATDGDPDARLTIIGEGPELDNLRRQTDTLGIADRVTFTGALPTQHDVWEHISGARCLLAPSEREGYGIAVAEALALGTPVVTSDHVDNAARHLVKEGVSGVVAISGDTDAFARGALIASDLDPSAVTATFFEMNPAASWEHTADGYADIYRRMHTQAPTRRRVPHVLRRMRRLLTVSSR